MPKFNPPDPDFELRIRSSFDQQQMMHTIGALLIKVSPGEVQIALPFSLAWTQQHRYVHAGIIATIADTACGYAAFTLMPASAEVLSVEYKINFLAPAKGEKFVGTGKVIKPGRTLTVCQGEVLAYDHGKEKLIATMQATMIVLVKEGD